MSVYGWSQQVYLRHSVTGGEALVADEPGVVDMYEAKGWARADVPAELDPDAPNNDAGPEAPAPKKRQREPEAKSANKTQEGDEVNG